MEHHLVIDGDIGVGEYTYRGTRQYHGLVILPLRDGVIAGWREYEVRSELPWGRVRRAESLQANVAGPRP